MKDIILYHGSRGGLQGIIKPMSRVHCDFGQGFYMGESSKQAQGMIAETEMPVFYKLRFRLSEIPEERILMLGSEEWLHVVMANRRRSEEFNALALAKQTLQKLKDYDVIIGPIADDRMNEAMQRFSDYGLTDKGLIACLASVDYGNQYVARTAFACGKIDILESKILKGKELADVRQYAEQKRSESRNVVNAMARKYQREGLYLNEIIDREKQAAGDLNDRN